MGSEEECIKGLNKERIETPIVMDKPVCYPFGWEFYRTGFTIAVINHFAIFAARTWFLFTMGSEYHIMKLRRLRFREAADNEST